MSWDPIGWLASFREASTQGKGFQRLRRDVFLSTVEAVKARSYSAEGQRLWLDNKGQYHALHSNTVIYPRTEELVVPEERHERFEVTAVTVIQADCLEVAQSLTTLGLDPVVLNMASRRNPGGGVANGAGAQEENLFRRSNLLYSLYQFVDYGTTYGVPRNQDQSYPIGRGSGAIYSPDATVFRSSEATGYDFLRRPFQVAFVTVPAISRPETFRRDGREWLTEELAEATRRKIRAIFRVAARHMHESLVLSAFGCGAFHNPPHHMARLFAEVLAEPELAGLFRAVWFAIIDDHNAWKEHNPEGNLIPFQRELGGLRIRGR